MGNHLSLAALALTLSMASTGCSTLAGTIASPLTGGVDAVLTHADHGPWVRKPVAFVLGTAVAPFVAFYNGINYDASHLASSSGYWLKFDDSFRPYGTLEKHN